MIVCGKYHSCHIQLHVQTMASVEAVAQDKIDFEKNLCMKISYHDGFIQTLFKKMGLYMQPHRDENFKFLCLHLSLAADVVRNTDY